MRATRATFLTGSILSVLLTLGIAPAVYARSIGAWAGNPVGISVPRGSCFTESAGSVNGVIASGCNGVWEVNLPIDASGSYTISFTAKTSSGALGSLSCGAYAVASNGTFTNTAYTTASTSTLTSYTLPSISVSSGGNLYIACAGVQFGQVGTINW